MRAVIQRVSSASVNVDQSVTGQIDQGLLVLLGVGQGDGQTDLDYIFRKTVGLRVFEDADGKMNLSLRDVGGQLLVVSQFTLYGDVRRGMRPGFGAAAAPEDANSLYLQFVQMAKDNGFDTQTGTFQADMQVTLVNDGPVTVLLDSKKLF
jgi:D-tyrosyl-tRNA(Tyr) deacylase